MATYTKAKIFNMALKNLGVSVGVQGATQTDRNTVVLNEYYDTAKEKTLTDHDWGFASTYREVTPTDNAISLNPRFLYKYDYPNDCVFIREVYQHFKEEYLNKQFIQSGGIIPKGYKAESLEKAEFETASDTQGRRIFYTSVSPAIIRYTRIVDEEAYYTPEFAMALSWYLAFLAASSITGARVKMSDCLQVYVQMLREATAKDANEGYKEDTEECDWIEARN